MSFTAQIGSFCTGTQKRLHGIRRGVMVKLFGAVILDTPVLTGRLRGNWRFSEGEPKLEPVERLDPSGQTTVKEAEAGAMVSRGEKPVYLTNNLPYARRIEMEGWSRKAPQGMMRRNVVRFGKLISIEAAKARK